MNYHNILHDDMLNGDGLRVVLFVSACDHKCFNCQNPQTWDCDSGIPFDENAKNEIFTQLDKDYISGITFSGGDPLHDNNIEEVYKLISIIKENYPNKTIWLYSGYTWEDIIGDEVVLNSMSSYSKFLRRSILTISDVFVDGRYIDNLRDEKYHWAGSTNQRVIDVQQSLQQNKVITIDK